jgi:hypothetical protein
LFSRKRRRFPRHWARWPFKELHFREMQHRYFQRYLSFRFKELLQHQSSINFILEIPIY